MAVTNAVDLEGEGEALSGLIEARSAAEGVEPKPEPERLEAAEAVLGAWPVPVSFGWDCASFHSPTAFCATWAHEQIPRGGPWMFSTEISDLLRSVPQFVRHRQPP